MEWNVTCGEWNIENRRHLRRKKSTGAKLWTKPKFTVDCRVSEEEEEEHTYL